MDDIKQETNLTIELAKSMAMGVAIQLTLAFIAAIGIWGLVFKRIIVFLLIGLIIGLLIAIHNAKIILRQRTVERANELMWSMGSLLGGVATILFILGIVIWVIRLIVKW